MEERPLRLIISSPLDALARTVEALLVVASAPLPLDDLVAAADDDLDRVEAALRLVGERHSEGRSGIVLEHVAGGYALRASREAASPCTRPEITRIRGVAAEATVANLLERGLVAEAGRDDAPGGAIRYRVTPLFERVFGLASLAELPRLDDFDGDVETIRERLHAVADGRGA